jgi:redox-sensitive bicupin YhaK (pirin superfamily)
MEVKSYKSVDRGEANHGWLHAKHTFSFAGYQNFESMNFGALRVLNDDIVAPGMGFGTHPHNNMEIITIPLRGSLEHKDSMGNTSVIKEGEIQVMSAGSGITHSEFNASQNNDINLFQLWIFPNKQNVEPRYAQFEMDVDKMKNNFLQVVSPFENEEGTWLYQNAWIHIAEFEDGFESVYSFKSRDSGVFVMNISGRIDVEGNVLADRDAVGIWDSSEISFKSVGKSKFLLVEVPMIF